MDRYVLASAHKNATTIAAWEFILKASETKIGHRLRRGDVIFSRLAAQRADGEIFWAGL